MDTLLPSAWQELAQFLFEEQYHDEQLPCEKADNYRSQEKKVENGRNTHQGELGPEKHDIGQHPPDDAEFAPAYVYDTNFIRFSSNN